MAAGSKIGQTLKDLWTHHGTKVLGFGSTILGSISLLDATTLHLIEQTLGPHRGHQVSSALMIVGGIGTAFRGFTNSQPK
jgi:hypothetical protein